MGSNNSKRKRKTLALLTAVATLAGGLTSGTAYAGGEGGNRPGTGGSGRYPEKKGRACGWVHLDVRAAKARWTG